MQPVEMMSFCPAPLSFIMCGWMSVPLEAVTSDPSVADVRYESQMDGLDESRRKAELKKLNDALLSKLQELDADICFSAGRFS